MKKLTILAGTLALLSCSTPEPEVMSFPVSRQDILPEATANSKASLWISGMTCEVGCKGLIERNIRTSAGVVSFNITFSDSSASVTFDSTLVSLNQLISRIASVGGGDIYSASPSIKVYE